MTEPGGPWLTDSAGVGRGTAPAMRLAKTVGVFTVMASAVSQEYGGGINYVLVHSVEQYPQAGSLIPLAMVVAGVVLIPKIALLGRFSQVMPRAGSTYVWLTRSVTPPVGFAVAFLAFVGVTAAIGFLALSFTTFVQGVLAQFGATIPWITSSTGQLVIGLVLIWSVFGLHYRGVGRYANLVTLLFVLIVVAAVTTIVVGFGTGTDAFTDEATTTLGHPVDSSAPAHPSFAAFLGVIGMFMFVYGGQLGATSLGGETRNATRSVTRGLWLGWGTALVLYTLISFALFHMASVPGVQALLDSGHEELATTPGITALVLPNAIGIALNVLVIVLIGKTLAPQMLDSSRLLFAFGQDEVAPRAVMRTNRFKAPGVALLTSAVLASVFLVEASLFGFEIGVLFRSASIVAVFGTLGAGVLNTRFNKRFANVSWARSLNAHRDVVPAAILAIVLAAALAYSVLISQGDPLLLQPGIQALIALVLAAVVYAVAARRVRRDGRNLADQLRAVPRE